MCTSLQSEARSVAAHLSRSFRQDAITAKLLSRSRSALELIDELAKELTELRKMNGAGEIDSAATKTRKQMHEQSEILHHVIAAMLQCGDDITDFSSRTEWPMLSLGDRKISHALEQLISDLQDLVPASTIGSGRGQVLLRWRWIVRYNFYPDSAIACFPFPDLFKVRMWPLIAHEIGHASIRSVCGKDLSEHFAHIAIALNELVEFACPTASNSWSERLQKFHVEELLADAFATYAFGLSYLYSFFVYCGDNSEPILRLHKSNETHFADWLVGTKHPATLMRLLIIIDILYLRGDLVASDRTSLVESFRKAKWLTSWHEKLSAAHSTKSRALVDALMSTIATLFPLLIKRTLDYKEAERFLSNPHASNSLGDRRSVVIASTLKRLSYNGVQYQGSSLVPAVVRALT